METLEMMEDHFYAHNSFALLFFLSFFFSVKGTRIDGCVRFEYFNFTDR